MGLGLGSVFDFAGDIVGGLIGGKKSKAEKAAQQTLSDPVPNLKTPAFSTNLNNNLLSLQLTPRVQELLRSQAKPAIAAGNQFGQLAGQVGLLNTNLPGAISGVFGQARDALRRERAASLGDLRSSLSRRRILGSSFGEDTINKRINVFQNADAELAAKQALATQQAELSQFATNLEALQFRSDLIRNQANALREAQLSQLEFLTNLGVNTFNFATNSQAVIADSARVLLDAARERSAGTGAFISNAVSDFGDILESL